MGPPTPCPARRVGALHVEVTSRPPFFFFLILTSWKNLQKDELRNLKFPPWILAIILEKIKHLSDCWGPFGFYSLSRNSWLWSVAVVKNPNGILNNYNTGLLLWKALPKGVKLIWASNKEAFILFSFFFFLIWTIFKVFFEFVTILLLFYVLIFGLQGMWDLSSSSRDRTRYTSSFGRWSHHHWTAREVAFHICLNYGCI